MQNNLRNVVRGAAVGAVIGAVVGLFAGRALESGQGDKRAALVAAGKGLDLGKLFRVAVATVAVIRQMLEL